MSTSSDGRFRLASKPTTRIWWASNPERIVVALYAFAFAVPLVTALIGRLPGVNLPYPYGTYAFILPLSITFWGILALPYWLGPLSSWFSLITPSVLDYFWIFILIAFYPLVSYYLWRRHRIAWTLSAASSLMIIALESFSALNGGGAASCFWGS